MPEYPNKNLSHMLTFVQISNETPTSHDQSDWEKHPITYLRVEIQRYTANKGFLLAATRVHKEISTCAELDMVVKVMRRWLRNTALLRSFLALPALRYYLQPSTCNTCSLNPWRNGNIFNWNGYITHCSIRLLRAGLQTVHRDNSRKAGRGRESGWRWVLHFTFCPLSLVSTIDRAS